MTPQELAVINTAIRWRQELPGKSRDIRLTIELEQRIWELITSCPQCNTDRHLCPGCGTDVGHGETACRGCESGEGTPPWSQARRLERLALEMDGTAVPVRGEGDPNEKGSRDHLWGEPAEDPLSGELIPAGQDAELERQGREIAGECAAGGLHGPHPHYGETCIDCEQCGTALVWIPRPMRDVRKGDVIRPAGVLLLAAQSTVTDRYWPTTPDGSDRGTWHVVPDRGSDKWAHTRDHVVQPGEVVVCLDGGEPRNMAPDFAVEILLAPDEAAAIEAIAWDNRLTTE